MGLTYAASGVDIDAGNRFAAMIRERVSAAWPGAGKEIGGFAGGIPLPDAPERRVIASTDGVGTKAMVAALAREFGGLGQDVVAMNVVDLYCGGGRPVAFLDTLKVGKLDPDRHIAIIDSVIAGCKLAGCRLVGGETAELPDMFRSPWMVDLDGTAIGVPRYGVHSWEVHDGCRLFGWPSYGLGCNGFSLARKVFKVTPRSDGASIALRNLDRRWQEFGNRRLADVLLEPTPIWITEIEKQEQRGVRFAAHAHITGGGFCDNVARILPDGLKAVIDRSSWVRPSVFRVIQELGQVSQDEMDRTFNNGVMVVSVVAPGGPPPMGDAFKIGEVRKRRRSEPSVKFVNEYRDM